MHQTILRLSFRSLVVALLGIASVCTAASDKDKSDNVNVNVVNQPTVVVADDRQPISFRYEAQGTALSNEHSTNLYQVPAGMRLTLTFVSGVASAPQNVFITAVELFAKNGSTVGARHFAAVPAAAILNTDSRHVVSFSQPFNLVVNAGEKVGLAFARSSAFQGSGTAFLSVNMSGYLEAAP